jgi:hypothetical protein
VLCIAADDFSSAYYALWNAFSAIVRGMPMRPAQSP